MLDADLVERYFPRGELISKKDWLEIRQTAYKLYRSRKEEYPRENWELAFKMVAMKKYSREEHGVQV